MLRVGRAFIPLYRPGLQTAGLHDPLHAFMIYRLFPVSIQDRSDFSGAIRAPGIPEDRQDLFRQLQLLRVRAVFAGSHPAEPFVIAALRYFQDFCHPGDTELRTVFIHEDELYSRRMSARKAAAFFRMATEESEVRDLK